MKTIDKILEHHFSEEETEALLACGIINGCGGEGSFSFDTFMKSNIELLSNFDPEKKTELLCDLKRICYEHDADFRLNRGFRMSNFRMAKKVYHLLHWTSKRFAIALILFILLNRYGKEFYYKDYANKTDDTGHTK